MADAPSLTGDGTPRPPTYPDPPGRPVDLHADGLLWLINRTVFHPRGYALAHEPGSPDFYLQGDGTDVWRFELSADLEDELFERVRRLLGP